MESLAMGCVSLSEGCFPGGRLSAKNFEKARLQVRLELEPVRSQFRKVEPAQVAGTSGSIRAAHAVLSALDRAPQGVTVEGLEYLIEEMISRRPHCQICVCRNCPTIGPRYSPVASRFWSRSCGRSALGA